MSNLEELKEKGFHPDRVSPARQTVEDAQGVERIISREDGSWSPAPTEATAEQKARAEAANDLEDEKREQRLASLGIKTDQSADGGTVDDDGIEAVNDSSSANAAPTAGVSGFPADHFDDKADGDDGDDDDDPDGPKGQELDDALDKKGLSKTGTAAEKRRRLRDEG